MPVLGTIGAAAARGFGLFGAIAAAVDPYFKYVTMLLPGNGTNGAQNNTFLDSGPNTLTITRNGNTTQGTFTPYGSNWANYFDGSQSYLSTASNAAYQFGTGDFTIECWINMAAGTSLAAFWRSFVSVCGDAVFTNGVTLYIGDGGSGSSVAGEVAVIIGTDNIRIYGGQDIRNLGWVHVAVTRSGTTLRLFVNGVQRSSVTNSSNINATSYGAQIGVSSTPNTNYFIGYVSNVRVVKGTAVYTSAFTPSTTPLTAISGTSLLTCQSNRFIDNSASPLTITVTGSPSVQRFSPFSPSASYSTSVVGGSGYFDGTGDYLTVADTAALQMGSGDFTIEFWINFSSISGYQTPYDKGYTNAGGLFIQTGNGNGRMVIYAGGSAVITETGTAPSGAWIHYALVRSGTTLTLYRDGVSSGSATNSTNFNNANQVGIGANGTAPGGGSIGQFPINGYMSSVRVVKGTAVYTSTFTPPTAPLTAITNTQLLLNMTNGGIIDNAMMNDLETVGSAQISTSVSKFGGGSINLSGGANWLLIASSQNFSMGTGDFTIEAWVYPTSSLSAAYNVVFSVNATGGLYFGNTTTGFGLRASSVGDICVTTVPSVNTWTHIAVTRSGTTVRLFYNGVQQNSATSSQNFVVGTGNIGSDGSGSNNWPGYIDDLRITKGYARYTANFTPPTAAFPTQ